MYDNDNEAADDLCRRCGLCCEGTLFDRTDLTAAEVVHLRSRQLATDVHTDGTPVIRLPCQAHQGDACGIYDDRPVQCRRYVCSLLDRLQHGEVTADHAAECVRRAIGLRDRLRTIIATAAPEHVGHPLSLAIDIFPSVDDLSADKAADRRWAGALLLFAELTRLLQREFQPPAAD